ncbi:MULTISPECIES: SDR family NAD(P)-dependent oxidoreductase [Brevibacillus]|jgi:NAD(P)-dependent dehydrogenase (short-subunit alcohol dehydrogenase family)|uniref:Short-chain dehydrogenase n=1 Tax=Brevibacillus parabrevis TaxID=54914 RepID=A0A4Y3PUG1_BREPA|nr:MULTISPECIES: SDR family NAD(P)-dependent oxidoreductase [Brevibacillus]MBU8712545.1 SDR family oxidoreductase [Brevibacillus parabrevis]MDR5000165.1 SDR family NAD(P)-dependent oxidoreductase [Brevibacillus parabrevis]MED1721194.1 SDR family NAD(P)-dependent oxidoreductase [Brevibacillus parabrevis]MED2256845.1 SDR family NAD(P)-dependent oxidoreductase [Brevibacillus parabrevis]NRQ56913.1 SDR family oxidoreductase [Brevibacillus sp. HD1.4A]
MKLANKVAIVTGGASGIGETTVRLFAQEGAKVVIADFSPRGDELAKELNEAGFEALFVKTDVTKEAEVKHMVDATVERFGQVDILFANAGIAKDAPAHLLSTDDWQRTIDINLTGVFLCDKYVIEQMLAQGTGGAIVNCGSIHSHAGKAGVTAYSSAKGGVKLLSQTLGITYAKQGIRVNAVCPGYIDTPLIAGRNEAMNEHLVSLHPMGRLGKPEEVAKAVLFLASDDASFVTGTSLLVDGGYTAQ